MMKWFSGALLLSALFCLGCGGAGGKVGDENDPANTTDKSQMQDETDDNLHSAAEE